MVKGYFGYHACRFFELQNHLILIALCSTVIFPSVDIFFNKDVCGPTLQTQRSILFIGMCGK